MIYELLPSTQRRRCRSRSSGSASRRYLLDRLNYDERLAAEGLIRTPTTPDGIIKDNSVLRMFENSLNDGALYRFRDPDTGEGDAEAMLDVLKDFWAAVRDTFAERLGAAAAAVAADARRRHRESRLRDGRYR